MLPKNVNKHYESRGLLVLGYWLEARLADFIPDDYRIDSNVRLIPTPGHTPHHVSVVVESQGKKAIISGDVLHHPCQIAYPDWITLADTYPDQTVETRKKFLSEIKDSGTLLIGSHFANPVAGYVITNKNKLEFNHNISHTPFSSLK